MKKKSLYWAVGIGLFSLGLVFNSNASTVNLQILETSDIHMHFMNYNYETSQVDNTVGLVKIATIIKQERHMNKNVLLVDAGDLLQGTAIADYIQAKYHKNNQKLTSHIAYKVLESLKYDVASLGNHEFNYGLKFLNQAIKSAHFPIINANIYHVDSQGHATTHYFKSSVILHRNFLDTKGKKHPIKIGVIGVLAPQIISWDRNNLLGRVTTKDIIQTVTEEVNNIRSQADIILVIAHSGPGSNDYRNKKENAGYQLTQIKGVDAVAIGHAHVVFPSEAYATLKGINVDKGTINGIPIVEPGFYGSDLGVIKLKLDIDSQGHVKVFNSHTYALPIYKKAGKKVIPMVKNDSKTVKLVSDIHKKTIQYMDQPVGRITQDLDSYYAISQNTPLLQLVNDVQLDYAKNVLKGTPYEKFPLLSSSAPYKAGWHGAYTSVRKGNVSLKNISDIYMYPNTLYIVKIKGEEVVEWLEKAVGFYSQIATNQKNPQDLNSHTEPSYNLDIFSNITYKIDLTKPARYSRLGKILTNKHRIIDVMYQGKPLDMRQEFLVATNNYRASGGGKFPGLDGSNIIYKTTDTIPNILKAYIIKHSPLTVKVPNNFTFKDNLKKAIVTFNTSGRIRYSLPRNLKLFKNNIDGSIQVRLR